VDGCQRERTGTESRLFVFYCHFHLFPIQSHHGQIEKHVVVFPAPKNMFCPMEKDLSAWIANGPFFFAFIIRGVFPGSKITD
jgi:hypothetical protein